MEGAPFPHSTSAPEWSYVDYCWKLEKFWELRALASIQALGGEHGNVLWSPPFGDTTRGIWQLKLYPYGDASAAGKGQISVFLSLDTKHKQTAYAIFSCSILDATGEKRTGPSYARQNFGQGNASWGWSRFVSVDDKDLLDVLTQDSIILRCTIDVFLGAKSVPQIPVPSKTLLDEMRTFFRSPDSCDVKLVCQSVVLDTQRALLAARSSHFRALLQGRRNTLPDSDAHSRKYSQPAESENVPKQPASPPTEDNQKPGQSDGKAKSGSQPDDSEILHYDREGRVVSIEIRRQNVTAYAVKQVLQYMLYDTCDALDCPPAELAALVDVFYTSWIFKVKSLYLNCTNVLLRCIDGIDNAVLILAVARKVECDELRSRCEHYLKNFKSVSGNESKLRTLLPLCAEPAQDSQLTPVLREP